MNLHDNITTLKNLGPARAKAFARAGVFSILDLLNFLPRDYEDRSVITPIADILPDLPFTIKAKVALAPKNSGFGRTAVTSAILEDESGRIEALYFNQPYMKNALQKGEIYYFSGKVILRADKLQMQSPDITKLSGNPLNACRIIPVYPSGLGFSQKLIRGYIKDALDLCLNELTDNLPEKITLKYQIMSRREAISNIHFPKSRDFFLKARERLIFEEFFTFQIALRALKGAVKKQITHIKIIDDDYNGLNIPFQLTNAQKAALKQIIADIKSGHPMYRLVQGDVGSGKTIVAAIAAYLAIKNGCQAAIMAPTEVLANQHFESFTRLFEPAGITCCLITGGISAAEKKAAYYAIQSGQAQMIIGTHALIQDKTLFGNLGLVITDEQHRFGVNQRIKLSQKSSAPHVLVMSATPIPRSLALVLYGDMDISVIDELPPGRKEIDTFALTTAYRKRVYNFISEQIKKGRQAYIICPSIEDGGKLDIENVLDYAAMLKDTYLKGQSIAVLHGKMKPAEKQEIMDSFVKGDIDLLVSTTVIEVGVNVPNATVMVVENGERFGLSQLHQLRGRVGRGSDKSYCILFSDSESAMSKERLSAMEKTGDGFLISELDLKLRGPGDFFGTRQHGLPELKIGDIVRDAELLAKAREAVMEYFDDIENNGEIVLDEFIEAVAKGF
ncbi:MAG: ATP-dependent DNA helicase RecG [Defluviitaleaceae bacterium]|nr:ATP-dependent DNA helicase RecG [Defluviitaleaceae bacterium]